MEADGEELLLRLRSGDERAFVSLVERYQEPMLRMAVSFVPTSCPHGSARSSCCATWRR